MLPQERIMQIIMQYNAEGQSRKIIEALQELIVLAQELRST